MSADEKMRADLLRACQEALAQPDEIRGYVVVALVNHEASGTQGLQMSGAAHCAGCGEKIGLLLEAIQGVASGIAQRDGVTKH